MIAPPRRKVPVVAAALILAMTATALALAVIAAMRAGPLVAHPPTAAPALPPPATQAPPPSFALPTMPQQTQGEPGGDWLWWVAAVLGGLIALAFLGWLLAALRRPRRIAPQLGGPAPAVTVEAVLAALGEPAAVDLGADRSFDPRRAADDIIASWSAVERAGALLGLPRPPSSTPTEFLSMLTERFGDPPPDAADLRPAGAADVLLRRYHHARFDTAMLAPGAATEARRAAADLLRAWGVAGR